MQLGIEGGVDAVGLVVQFAFIEFTDDGIAHQIDKVRRIARFHIGWSELQRRGLGLLHVSFGGRVSFHHAVEHYIAALECAFRMAIRRQVTRRLNQSRNKSGLGKGNVLEILIEVRLRRCSEPTDGERSALTYIHAVGIKLENLLLSELLLQLHRNQHFRDFAFNRFLRSQKERARELHSNSRTALLMPLMSQVDPCSLGQTHEVHATMLEEAPVFNGEHGVHQNLGDLVVLHQLTLGTLLRIEQRRNHLRFEFVSRQLARLSGDALHLPATYADGRWLRAVIGIRPRLDLDAVIEQAIAAHEGLAVFLCICCPAKSDSDLTSVDFLAHLHGLRYGVNLGRIAENLPFELLIDDVVVLQVVIRKHAGENYS